jgi:hypothetical protein
MNSWQDANGAVVMLQGFYVAKTATWEGPARRDYMAARIDLLEFITTGKRWS